VADVVRYRHGDRRAVDALYRRVFGIDAAEASRLRWDWQYHLNPNNPGNGPEIWVAREGPALIGHYATMPVKPVTNIETTPPTKREYKKMAANIEVDQSSKSKGRNTITNG